MEKAPDSARGFFFLPSVHEPGPRKRFAKDVGKREILPFPPGRVLFLIEILMGGFALPSRESINSQSLPPEEMDASWYVLEYKGSLKTVTRYGMLRRFHPSAHVRLSPFFSSG